MKLFEGTENSPACFALTIWISVFLALSHSFQPFHDLVVVHDVVGDEFIVDVQKNDAPLKRYSHFIGASCELPEPQPLMTMRISEGFSSLCNGQRAFLPEFRRKFGRRFPNSLGEDNRNHNLPVNF